VDSRGSWEAGDTDVRFADGKLTGTASFVQDAQKADYFLVKARAGDGLGLYWVAKDAAGVTIKPDAIVDLTRDQACIEFADAEAVEVCSDARAALDSAMPAIWTMTAADMVGAGEWELQTTAEYARTRKQFEREIGFFQAVKHPLVDVMVEIDQSKSLVYNAACAIDHEPAKAARFAHMAKASASDMAVFASGRAVQFHGGIGFTWECYVHLYFKRQNHNAVLWGDGAWHRARLADILMGEAA
jgi:alkylation response protein AidB-like acyl-CoA dehydrogenase